MDVDWQTESTVERQVGDESALRFDTPVEIAVGAVDKTASFWQDSWFTSVRTE
jgi:hypothetical protein